MGSFHSETWGAFLNQMALDGPNARQALSLLEYYDRVLDVLDRRSTSGLLGFDDLAHGVRPESGATPSQELVTAAEIEPWLRERYVAKKSRDFARSDQIRSALQARGVIVEDVGEGMRWKLSR